MAAPRTLAASLVALLATAAAFDISCQESRRIESVLGDNLLAYNALLTWRELGDPLTSFTLTPSPYFLDMLVQWPLAAWTSDFERFAWFEALAYASLTCVAFIALFRALGASRNRAAVAAGVTMATYFICFPQTLVLHLHVPNHTSEVIGSLFGAALLAKLSRPSGASGVSRRRLVAAFGALVFVNAVSSTFFLATFVIPALGALLVLAWRRSRRRIALTLMASALVSAALGTVVQSSIAELWWPIRKDLYGQTIRQSAQHLLTVLATPAHRVATIFFAVGLVLGVALWIRVRQRRVALTFFLLVVLCCGGLPVLRGAFEWTYSFRFLQLPALLSLALVVGTAISAGRHAWSRVTKPIWGAASLGTLVLLFFFEGPLSESSPRSMTSSMLGCMRAPEHMSMLEDGLATVLPARFLNASFRGPAHEVPNVVVELERWHPPSLVVTQNAISWFRGGYRKGKRAINFVVIFQLPTESLAWLRKRVGAPDLVFHCPMPADWHPVYLKDRAEPDVETWVWTSDEAKRKLEEMVVHDNMRGMFVFRSDHEATLDAKWGMEPGSESTELVSEGWSWQRREGTSARVAWSRPMFIPAGRYRADVDLVVGGPPPRPGAPPNGVTITTLLGAETIARASVAVGVRSASFEYVNKNPGGATSGDNNWFVVDAEAGADRVEVHGIRLTRLEASGPDPLRVFH